MYNDPHKVRSIKGEAILILLVSFLKVCRDFVHFLQVLQYLTDRGSNLLGKVGLLLPTELYVPPQQLPIQNLVLGTVQVLVVGVECSGREGSQREGRKGEQWQGQRKGREEKNLTKVDRNG